MKLFELYTHPKFVDVAMMPVKCFYVPQGDYFKVKVRWFNNSTGTYCDMGIQENLEISRSKAKEFIKL